MPVVTDPHDLGQLVGKLRHRRGGHDDTKQELVDLFMPFRGDITTKMSPGSRRRPLHDSFGVMVADRFTNFLNGSLYPSSSDWLRLRQAEQYRLDQRIQEAFDASSQRILEALERSNFYVASHTDTRDWGVMGNSCLYVAHDDENARGPDDFAGFVFDPIPWSRVWWTYSHIGRPLVVVRSLDIANIDARAHFNKQGDRLPRIISDRMRDDPYGENEILHIIQRDPQGQKGTIDKPWKSIWYHEGSSTVMRLGGFDNNPYIAARMIVLDGEQYGRGRGDIARPAMKGANEIARQKYIGLGKEINPPFMAEEDEIAMLDLTPGGHVVVRPPKEVTPGYLRSGTDFNVIEVITDNLHRTVDRIFLGDALGEPERADRVKDSVRERENRALIRLSATGQTLMHEKLRPLTENLVDIMLEKNALPELQEVIDENGDIEFEPVFTSPFFTAMKSQSLTRIDRFLERRLQWFERTGDPSAFEDIDRDELRDLEQQLGDVPARLFKAIEEIEGLRNARGDNELIETLLGRSQNQQTQVQVRPRGVAAGGGLA